MQNILALRIKELLFSNGVYVSYNRLHYNVSIYTQEREEYNNIGDTLYRSSAEILSTSTGF